MSADDIHKAKRRQQYLQEAGIALLPLPAAVLKEAETEDVKVVNVDEEGSNGRPRKRVSFANEAELVKVCYFEPDDSDDHDRPLRGTGTDFCYEIKLNC